MIPTKKRACGVGGDSKNWNESPDSSRKVQLLDVIFLKPPPLPTLRPPPSQLLDESDPGFAVRVTLDHRKFEFHDNLYYFLISVN